MIDDGECLPKASVWTVQDLLMIMDTRVPFSDRPARLTVMPSALLTSKESEILQLLQKGMRTS